MSAFFVLSGCGTFSTSNTPGSPTCIPECAKTDTCYTLDSQLIDARQPFLHCIRKETDKRHLDRVHRCFRSLRLLESARWWFQTLTAQSTVLPSVYAVPIESERLLFFCYLEQIAKAQTPEKIEELYTDMIRAYP